MALLQITVFPDAMEVPLGVPAMEEAVTFAGVSVQSSALPQVNNKVWVHRVRVIADADCWVTWGDDPTATTDGSSGRMVAAEAAEYFAISSGKKIAVIAR